MKGLEVNVLMLTLPLLSNCNSQSLAWNKQVVLVHGLSHLSIESDCPVLIGARKISEVNLFSCSDLLGLTLYGVLKNVYLFVEPLDLVALRHAGEELATL